MSDIRADDGRVLAIAALIREELEREAAAGFPTLTQIPSTGVIKLLDYLATLSDGERMALIEAQARVAALCFFPAPLISAAHEHLRSTEPALLRRAASFQAPEFSYGLRYLGLRMHRAVMNDPQSLAELVRTRATLDFTPRDDLPEALVGTTPIRDIATAKAPLLRKLLNQMLRARLGAKPEKRPGGELVYEGAIDGIPLRVSIIFSNLYAQVLHGVTWSLRERTLLAQRLTYEVLWGTNSGWDYLTEENAERSIDLLDRELVNLAALFGRIAALPAGN
ncbi:MAG: hypothetical protein WA459_03240 [Stellaceae bacterium]